MARTTRKRAAKGGKIRIAGRLLAPVVQGVGLGKNVLGAGVNFAGSLVRSTGKLAGKVVTSTGNRFNGAVGGLLGRKKTRRNRRNNRSQRR
jgi:hypothetical protein